MGRFDFNPEGAVCQQLVAEFVCDLSKASTEIHISQFIPLGDSDERQELIECVQEISSKATDQATLTILPELWALLKGKDQVTVLPKTYTVTELLRFLRTLKHSDLNMTLVVT